MKRSLGEDEGPQSIKRRERRLIPESQEQSSAQLRSTDVREKLRQSIAKKQASQLSDKENLEHGKVALESAGFKCEIVNITTNNSPFLEDEGSPNERHVPLQVLIIHASKVYSHHYKTGPFQPVRLVVYTDGSWKIQCQIYDYIEVSSGKLDKLDPTKLVVIASTELSPHHVLCPGILKQGDEVESEVGYFPKNLRKVSSVNTVHSSKCKVWHVPSRKQQKKWTSSSDPRWSRLCTECCDSRTYIKRRSKKRECLGGKRFERQRPNSNYPWKFLSPTSKTTRTKNVRQQRSRLKKQVNKLYKRTKIELPENQSEELCKLIDTIEVSNEGKTELENIRKEGNKTENEKGLKAGDTLMEVWKKDRESFFKDQRKNGKIK